MEKERNEIQGARSLNKLEILSPCYFVLSHSSPESHQVLCLLKPWCLLARAALFPWRNGSSLLRGRSSSGTGIPQGAVLCVGQDGEMGRGVPPGSTPGAAGLWAPASCGSAVCAQPPAALGAPAARGACRVLPSLYLWKSLIEMQVIKSNVSCSIHFHCTTTFTSPILSGISAAPLSGFFLVRAMAILSPLCELCGRDNSKPAVDC